MLHREHSHLTKLAMPTTVTSNGPYVGLPTFSETGLTALVAGANGISGQYMLRVLSQNPQRWTKIYSLSRRPPQGFNAPNVEHVALDFLSGEENIRKTLNEKGVKKVDFVFFFAYKEASGPDGELWAGQEQMVEENGKMLEDFLLAMKEVPFKRIVLQTGAKVSGSDSLTAATLTDKISVELWRPHRSYLDSLSRKRSTRVDGSKFLLQVGF